MTQTLDTRTEPDARAPAEPRFVVFGDFNCPYSYLASRRAAVLAAQGVVVDWRAVEHDPWVPRRFADSSVRVACLEEEMEKVTGMLLPGERLPYEPAGFLPYTKAAVTGYAEAYGAGVAAEARTLLFDAFWTRGVDLGNPRTVRALLADTVRCGSTRSGVLRDWGCAVDVTGGPVTTLGWRTVGQWRAEWLTTGKEVVPTLLEDGRPLFGEQALDRLAGELVRRGLDPAAVPLARTSPPRPYVGDVADHAWVSQHGNRWMRDFRDAPTRPAFPHVG